jgi:CheY-like chemotaxis protein
MPEGLDRIRNARILVVEDSIANQTLARDLLKHAGCHVDLAGNGMEAIQAIRNAATPYDAVLMDLQMPIMDGLEATTLIREELSLNGLPIIATTANVGKKELERCLAAGANDCLPKPFHIHELYAVMVRWVNSGVAGADAGTSVRDETVCSAPAEAEVMLPAEIDGIDIEDGLARVGQDRKLYAGLLVEFAGSNAQLTVEIDAAFVRGDLERVRFLAHGIRSTAGNIGADALSLAAAELEELIMDGGDDVAGALERFRVELEKTVSVIHAADVGALRGPASWKTGESGFDRDEAEKLIEILLDMLDDQDLDSQREFEKLTGILAGRGHDKTLEEMGKNMEALEFSNARQILMRVGREILN